MVLSRLMSGYPDTRIKKAGSVPQLDLTPDDISNFKKFVVYFFLPFGSIIKILSTLLIIYIYIYI